MRTIDTWTLKYCIQTEQHRVVPTRINEREFDFERSFNSVVHFCNWIYHYCCEYTMLAVYSDADVTLAFTFGYEIVPLSPIKIIFKHFSLYFARHQIKVRKNRFQPFSRKWALKANCLHCFSRFEPHYFHRIFVQRWTN